ncbi:MAG: hypothetical protein OEV00_02585 [Acidobacteriota bacterium]|nr:hypothetical protein [Acidobacteriota bacterium]MDH3784196.1 hypothetical protein [Acidobacteriota bacterium]
MTIREGAQRRRRWLERSGIVDVELYRRHSVVMAVRRDGAGRWERRDGEDVGTAIRWVDDDGRIRFTAGTGDGPAPETAHPQSLIEERSSGAPWRSDPQVDGPVGPHRQAYNPIDPLRQLEEELRPHLPGSVRMGDRQVEIARIDEDWEVTGGRAGRSRDRFWSRVQFEAEGETDPPPITVSSQDPWSAVWVARQRCADFEGGASHPRYLLLPPEQAAALTRQLAGWWSRRAESGERNSVGPGWVVKDDPSDPRGTIQARFDDALFETRITRLADGRRLVAALPEVGGQRRGSFRDPPSVAPWHLVVEPQTVAPTSATCVATAATLQVLDGERWAFVNRQRHWSFSPEEWTRRCVGGVGGALTTHIDVTTPGLLIEL